MPLAMSRPWKHPKTGIYWLRKRVPDGLLKLVGKREELRTLGTRDPAEAKVRHAAALAEIEARWATLRAGPKKFSEREALDLAAPVGEWLISQYRNNPSEQKLWRTEYGDAVFLHKPAVPLGDYNDLKAAFAIRDGDFDIMQMEQWCRNAAAELSSARGLQLDETALQLVARCIARIMQAAGLKLKRLTEGEREDVVLQFSGYALSLGPSKKASLEAASFTKLIGGWSAERRPAQKTIYDWTRLFKELALFLGHDNAGALTADDLIRWKSVMVAKGLKAKTIQDGRLAPVRSILQWGVDNKLLEDNAADKVRIDTRSKQGEKIRSFTEEEAKTVLRASQKANDSVRRWVPWIAAFTGARVSEICQLRREDVVEIEGIWCFKVMPEAGSLKTSGSERIIPIHPALQASGVLDFAKKTKAGPIFPNLTPDKFGKRGGNGTKVIGRFVRQLGITDKRISPSHSWRHRIKTLGRKYGLARDILDAITGHSSGTDGDSYGEFPVEALYRELCKIPTTKL